MRVWKKRGKKDAVRVSLLTQGVQMVLLSLMVHSRKWPGIKYATIGKNTLIDHTQ
jgi:hypothetical protein